jgi:hypothetical protein
MTKRLALSFAPAGLAAPLGILGPDGSRGARGNPAPYSSPRARSHNIETGPKTNAAPVRSTGTLKAHRRCARHTARRHRGTTFPRPDVTSRATGPS